MTTTGSPTDEATADEPDERRRLLPRFTRRQNVALGIALLYLAGAIGYALASRQPGRPGKDSVDVGFLTDMITHHDQAVTMSNAELVQGGDEKVEVFAREIMALQSREIGFMQQKLSEWGYESDDEPVHAMGWMEMPVERAEMPGMAGQAELDSLNDAEGRDADALFVALMQDHHRGGVHMADYAAKHAESRWVRDLAATMARNQRIEINELERARLRAGLPSNPPAYVPAQIPAAGPEPGHH